MIPVIAIGARPVVAGPEKPLEHLMACHRRIEDRLQVLERIADAMATKPEEAREALRRCFDFFESSGVQHTADEEESIFPRILPRLGRTELALVEDLRRQHVNAQNLYAELKAAKPEDGESFRQTVHRFCELYRAHIEAEDHVMIPAAEALLTSEELTAITSEMRRRRA